MKARLLTTVIVLVSCVGCDQATKALATDWLASSPPLRLLGGAITLTYAENAGGFLGLGSRLAPALRWLLFGGGTVFALLAGVYAILRARLRRLQVLGLALMVAGGLGNLVDRILFGSVRDFVQVGWGGLRTGVFNVADLGITVGVVLVLLGSRRRRRSNPRDRS